MTADDLTSTPRAARPPLRLAVLSFWHVHARDYSQDALAHPDTELVAVWDDDAVRGRAGAEAHGAAYVPDLDAVLADPDIDGVIVTTATAVHHEVMTRAAAAGKHIFTEKVLAGTVAECESIIAACDAAGRALTVSLPRLYHGSTLAIRELLAGGRLGTLTYARVRLSHDGASAGWLPERFFDRDAALGGALIDLGCHPVYLTQLLLGSRPQTVAATYRSLTGRAVEDHAVVIVGYASGAIGVIESGFVSDDPFSIEVRGTTGSLTYSPPDGLRLWNGDQPAALPVGPDASDAFVQWVDHIRWGTRADDNLARAVELTRLIAAANEAATTGRTVTLESEER